MKKQPETSINTNNLPYENKSDVKLLDFIIEGLYEQGGKVITEKMIQRFGSLCGVFKATKQELENVAGVTDRVATFFMIAQPAYRQALIRSSFEHIIDSERSAARYLVAYFMNITKSADYCIYIDKRDRVLSTEEIAGEDPIRKAVGGACRCGAAKIISVRATPYLMRVKPNARALYSVPSIMQKCNDLNIHFIDHIEYAPFKLFSLRRAVAGNKNPIDITDTDDKKYEKPPDFYEKSVEYIKKQAKLIKSEYLKKREN